VRTILDLAATDPEHLVEKAIHEAEVNRPGGPLSLDDLLVRLRDAAAAGPSAPSSTGGGSGSKSPGLSWRTGSSGSSTPTGSGGRGATSRSRATPSTARGLEQRVIVELDGRRFHDTARSLEVARAPTT
jgi:hypothetical protein